MLFSSKDQGSLSNTIVELCEQLILIFRLFLSVVVFSA